MSYLLDTCIISECVKKKPDGNVSRWFNKQQQSQLFLSAISIAEIKKGIYKIKFTQPERALILQNWLNTVEAEFSQRILPISGDVLEHWAQLSARTENQGNKLAMMDSLIAATALCYDLKMVTRNVDDFKSCGIELINPFSGHE
jgi:predicted nucleic acid-binding protein